MNRIKTFFKEAKQEFGHINWPTKAETIRMVIIVISISLVMAIYLGALDYGFLQGIRVLLKI